MIGPIPGPAAAAGFLYREAPAFTNLNPLRAGSDPRRAGTGLAGQGWAVPIVPSLLGFSWAAPRHVVQRLAELRGAARLAGTGPSPWRLAGRALLAANPYIKPACGAPSRSRVATWCSDRFEAR